jgi:predicted nucleic acid-binding protein
VARYELNAHDALVSAVTLATPSPHLVALDRDFRRVDGIELWQPA